jgi:hypothetical protein
MMRYAVVRIDNGAGNPHTGIVSNHKTEEAAREAIDRANRQLKKSPGQSSSWHPYAVLDRESGAKNA